jgi:hypothetical protein
MQDYLEQELKVKKIKGQDSTWKLKKNRHTGKWTEITEKLQPDLGLN